jgi:hypothetical protein
LDALNYNTEKIDCQALSLRIQNRLEHMTSLFLSSFKIKAITSQITYLVKSFSLKYKNCVCCVNTQRTDWAADLSALNNRIYGFRCYRAVAQKVNMFVISNGCEISVVLLL